MTAEPWLSERVVATQNLMSARWMLNPDDVKKPRRWLWPTWCEITGLLGTYRLMLERKTDRQVRANDGQCCRLDDHEVQTQRAQQFVLHDAVLSRVHR